MAKGISAARAVWARDSRGVTRCLKKYVAMISWNRPVGSAGNSGPPGLVHPVSWRKTKQTIAIKPSRATLYQNCTVQETSSTMKPENVPPATVPRRMQQV